MDGVALAWRQCTALCPPPPLDQLAVPPPSVVQFFGVSGFGFTKENELFVGRMAQLGFAAGELTSGAARAMCPGPPEHVPGLLGARALPCRSLRLKPVRS